MGKPTGFMEITRQTSLELPPEERIRNFNEFHVPLHTDEQQAQGAPGVHEPGLPRPVRGGLHLRQRHG